MGGICGGGSKKASNRGSVSSSKSSSSRSAPVRRRSAGRGSGANKTVRQTAQSVTRNIGTDLKMGFSTFGMSKDRQAEKLSQMGYSPKAIDSYQARTAASAARMREQMARSNDNDNDSRPARVSTIRAGAPSASVTETPTPMPPEAPEPIGEDMSAPEPGSAEEKVVEGAKRRRGRASTIATAPSGLLTQARTRRRRSLMGGDEPSGLIS